ncbi:MAG: hypothetical protein ACLP36_11390 [Acidimicrobiales bacterium]
MSLAAHREIGGRPQNTTDLASGSSFSSEEARTLAIGLVIYNALVHVARPGRAGQIRWVIDGG